MTAVGDRTATLRYCISESQRAMHVRSAIARPGLGRLQPAERRPEAIALVCYGPSLRTTWQYVRRYPYVITCSGSHRFLLDRGIVPTWHVDVDPRPHKITLLGTPDLRVTYLPCSACHPTYFDHLQDQRVLVWHAFHSDDPDMLHLPVGEWALTGGCDVGQRALVIAAMLGFRTVGIFGMDGSMTPTHSHAADHPKARRAREYVHEGVTYLTTPGMLQAAQTLAHELDMLPALDVRFYGRGLVQAMMRSWKPPARSPKMANVVALVRTGPK